MVIIWYHLSNIESYLNFVWCCVTVGDGALLTWYIISLLDASVLRIVQIFPVDVPPFWLDQRYRQQDRNSDCTIVINNYVCMYVCVLMVILFALRAFVRRLLAKEDAKGTFVHI